VPWRDRCDEREAECFLGPGLRGERQRLDSVSRTLPGLHGVLGRTPVWYFARQRLVSRSRVFPSGHLRGDLDFEYERGLYGPRGPLAPVFIFSRQRLVSRSRVFPSGHGDLALVKGPRGLYGPRGPLAPVLFFSRQRLVSRSRVLPFGHLPFWLDFDIDFDIEPDLEPKNWCGIFLEIISFLFIKNNIYQDVSFSRRLSYNFSISISFVVRSRSSFF